MICFKNLLEVLSCLRGIIQKLELEASDVLFAYKGVSEVVSTLQGLRSNSEYVFKRMYTDITKLGKELLGDDFELKQPRTSIRQMHRNNVQANTPEQYYLIAFFNEFLSDSVMELNERFTDISPCSLGLLHLLPSQCLTVEPDILLPEELVQAAEFYIP